MDVQGLRELFRAVVPDDDRPLAVYSGLWLFSRLISAPAREIPTLCIDALCGVAGPHRTIIMPTYTSGFRDGVIDLDKEPSQTGVITETFRRRSDSHRTASAFFSFAAIGPEASDLAELRPQDAWGTGSLFEWMEERDAHVVVLGEAFHRNSFVHRAEWLAQVPYRYRKTFTGTMTYRGKQESLTESLFVRSLDPEVTNDWHNLDPILMKAGMVKLRLGGGHISSMPSRMIVEVMLDELDRDPFCFTHDPDGLRRSGLRATVGRPR